MSFRNVTVDPGDGVKPRVLVVVGEGCYQPLREYCREQGTTPLQFIPIDQVQPVAVQALAALGPVPGLTLYVCMFGPDIRPHP